MLIKKILLLLTLTVNYNSSAESLYESCIKNKHDLDLYRINTNDSIIGATHKEHAKEIGLRVNLDEENYILVKKNDTGSIGKKIIGYEYKSDWAKIFYHIPNSDENYYRKELKFSDSFDFEKSIKTLLEKNSQSGLCLDKKEKIFYTYYWNTAVIDFDFLYKSSHYETYKNIAVFQESESKFHIIKYDKKVIYIKYELSTPSNLKKFLANLYEVGANNEKPN